MTKNFNAWELQQKINEVDNKANISYVDENIDTINTKIINVNSKIDKEVSDLNSSLNNKITTTKTELNKLISDTALATKKALHPVNSIYLSLNSTNPNTLFGFGTWELISQGRTLVGVDTTDTDFNTAGKTGGSKTHSHDSGTIVANIGAIEENIGMIGYDAVRAQKPFYNMGIVGTRGLTSDDIHVVNHATSTSGNTSNASSLQPYFCVYIFKRTA